MFLGDDEAEQSQLAQALDELRRLRYLLLSVRLSQRQSGDVPGYGGVRLQGRAFAVLGDDAAVARIVVRGDVEVVLGFGDAESF